MTPFSQIYKVSLHGDLCGPPSPKAAAVWVVGFLDSLKNPPAASELKQRDRLFTALLKARYGLQTDLRWPFAAAQVRAIKLMCKKFPKKADFYRSAGGQILWDALSGGKLVEVAGFVEIVDSKEVFNPLHVKVIDAYVSS